jgi:two-component system nitrogen regulation response regulator GlnG
VELIRRAVEESLREEVSDERNLPVPEILGQAPAMQDVFRAIGRLSQSNVTVLITGESGSGKELVARAAPPQPARRAGQRPFIAINTAAIPKDLLESELFGHERGAFTGAQTMRRGRFEQADGGTLFLDEIGDMPSTCRRACCACCRTASSTAWAAPAAQGQCAGHRRHPPEPGAAGARWRLPRRPVPPPERHPPAPAAAARAPEDVPALARFFLQKSAKELGVEPKRITDEALERLKAFSFPGNVRQLENVCHWLTVMAPAQVIESKDLPPEILSQSPAGNCRPRWRTDGDAHRRRPAAGPAHAGGAGGVVARCAAGCRTGGVPGAER